MISHTDENGTSPGDANHTTIYTHNDPLGRLTLTQYPDGGNVQVNYNGDPSPPKVTVTTATGSTTPARIEIYQYDGLGRVTQTQLNDPAGTIFTDVQYDPVGNIASLSNPYRNTSDPTFGYTAYAYDALGRKVMQCQPDNGTGNNACVPGNNYQQWIYNGSTSTFYDEVRNGWQRKSDAWGRLTNVTEPGNLPTNYSYDALGNLLTVNQLGNSANGEVPRIRSFVYDSLSRLTSASNPETGTINYSYDANGNLHQKSDARGITTTYSYDALNRLTSRHYSDGTPTAGFGYDGNNQDGTPLSSFGIPTTNAIGRMSLESNEVNAGQAFGYDAMGRLAIQTNCVPSSCWNTYTQASYDLAGNLTALTYPDGRVVKQTFDSAAHLQGVTFDNWNGQNVGYTYASGFTYTPAGAQAEVTYGNGVYTHTPYNNRQQMCQVWSNNSQPLIDTHIYYGGSTIYCNSTPGNNGNITQVKDWRNPNHTRYFGYDTLNRINAFSNGDSSMQQSYSYDSFGNLSQSGTLNSVATFNAQNQINSGGYGYNSAGNLTSFNNGAFTATYAYDADNQITNVNNGGAMYTYDGNGQRARKDVGSSWTEYTYFNGQPLAEKNSDGSWSDYIYANGQRIARADSFDARIHIHGTTPGGKTASWQIGGGGYVIKPNDQLFLRQFQYMGFGGPNVQFTDGTQTYQSLVDSSGQPISSLQTEQQWVERSIDLSPFAGKTVSATQVVTDFTSPAATYDIYYGDIAIVSSDGTVTPIYVRQQGATFANVDNEGQTNLSAFEEASNYPGDSVQGLTTTTYYHGDQIGSTRMLTSAGGWPVSSDTFYPFGQEQNPTTDPNHYKFTGQERDSESNLDYFKARHFNFTTGQFMSPDPYDGSFDASNPQSFNRYSYVLNSPLNLIDPSGLQGVDPCHGDPTGCGSGSDGCGVICAGVTLGIGALVGEIASLFDHPAFHGSLQPRPNANGMTTANGTYSTITTDANGVGFMQATYTTASNSAYSLSWSQPLFTIVVPVGEIPIPIASLTFSPTFTYIPKMRTACLGGALGLASGTGKGLTFAAYPSTDASFSEDVVSSFGWNFQAQTTPYTGFNVLTNSSGTLSGLSVSSTTGAAASYGWTSCRHF